MTSDSRWQRIEELYHAALERHESERAAFLLAACDDDALRHEVESLLAEGAADQFLTTPAIELAGREMVTSRDALIGRHLGPYEILSLLGAGGMGVVYRARDTKLQREVAIKVLPDAVAADPDRIARFAREARLLAALNHPHIATVYGLEEGDGVSALVLELVEGETLAERLSRGPLASTDAIAIAKQIVDGLEAAHDHGIIHRDLKPSNIKLRSDGTIKILDFGLAKVLAATGVDGDSALMHRSSPTLVGLVTGTPAYMSPEQAQGHPVDTRTDVWAFGCVFYEMLTGKRAFAVTNVGETFAAVMGAEPSWDELPSNMPPGVRSLLRRCLQKNAARRLRHIADARFHLEDTVSDSDDRPPIAPRTRTALERSLWAACVLVAVGAGVAGGLWWAGRAPLETKEAHLEINTPPTRDWTSLAVSPDGTKVAFVGIAEGSPRLWVRLMNAASADPLKGTDNAAFPFWSPNSRSIGFFADGQLKRIDIDSGALQVIGPAAALGGTWNQEGTILFSADSGAPLFSISDEGQNRTQVTRVSLEANSPRFPHFLPDGRHFLFHTIGTEAGIYLAQLGALDRNPPRRLIPDAQAPTYASSGHLFFVRQGTLFAQPFDADQLKLTGDARSIAERVVLTTEPGSAALSVSQAGHVVYRTGSSGAQHEFVWFDRSGKEIAAIPGSGIGSGFNASLSPDGHQLAIGDNRTGTTDIWLLDIGRGVPSKFTFHQAFDIMPVWSPDSKQIAFASNRRAGTDFDLYMRRIAGGGDDQLLIATENEPDAPNDWSRDSRFILYTGGRTAPGVQAGNLAIWALSVDDRKAVPVVQTGARAWNAQFSPDMRWVAYQSDKSGAIEIYVQPFRREGRDQLVSIGGGVQAQWRDNGEELFYLAPDDRLMAVSVRRDPAADELHFGKPVALFTARPTGATRQGHNRQYSVSRDGQRFLIDTLREAALPITVVLNWKPTP
jgi:serine/threonine protein kinase